ncbi:MAG TPA: DinB family protein [Ktedonobacterales bacterium]
MRQEKLTLAPFYQGWDTYQAALVQAIAPLSEDQLALRAAPSLRPVWLLAAHIIGSRVSSFQDSMGEGDPALAALESWDAEGALPRTAAELVQGLEANWQMIHECLDRWTPANLADIFVEQQGWQTYSYTRQRIIWGFLKHDLHHGGELFLTLGIHGLHTPEV